MSELAALEFLWFTIIVILLTGFAILDGFIYLRVEKITRGSKEVHHE